MVRYRTESPSVIDGGLIAASVKDGCPNDFPSRFALQGKVLDPVIFKGVVAFNVGLTPLPSFHLFSKSGFFSLILGLRIDCSVGARFDLKDSKGF